jgi:hypothetical protein
VLTGKSKQKNEILLSGKMDFTTKTIKDKKYTGSFSGFEWELGFEFEPHTY